jgi:hypothetical protein
VSYLGVDIYTHNRATRRFAADSHEAIPVTRQVRCPFCTGNVLMVDNRIKWHLEWRGFTMCPVSGFSLEAATAQAAHLMEGGEE